jgi:hypothetical protein
MKLISFIILVSSIIITIALSSCSTSTTSPVIQNTTAPTNKTVPSTTTTTTANLKTTTTTTALSTATAPTTVNSTTTTTKLLTTSLASTTTTITQKPTTSAPRASVANYKISITITSGGVKTASVTLADLKKLPQLTSSAQETGPTLASLLNSLGAQNYTQVTVYGDSSTPATLLKAQITEKVMLALTDWGTATLTGADTANQIIDVNNIVVQ